MRLYGCNSSGSGHASPPEDAVYHLRVDAQVMLLTEHDLSGPQYDLVTAVLAIGEALH